MVTQVSSFGRNGVSDWIVQRVSAVVLAAYFLCIFGFIVMHPGLDYATWSGYFEQTAMQVFTLLALLSTCAHAWIGMWTIGSDYLQEHTLGERAQSLRFIYQIGCVLVVITYFVWGINILWGN